MVSVENEYSILILATPDTALTCSCIKSSQNLQCSTRDGKININKALCYTFQCRYIQRRGYLWDESDEKAIDESINVLREINNVGVDGGRLGFGAPSDRHCEAHIAMSWSAQQAVLAIVQQELLLSGFDLVLRKPE